MKRVMTVLGLFSLLILPAGNVLAQQIIIKYAYNDPPSLEVTKHAAAVYIQNSMTALTEGKIKVELYPSEQLGGEKENLEGVKLGTIQMSSVSETVFSAFVPEVLVASYPYAFLNEQAVYNFWEGPFARGILGKIEQKMGVRVLGLGDVGFRDFTNSKRPIRTPADMVGLKFRVREVPTEVANVKALGADATPIVMGEVYTALQMGVIDGQENPISTIAYWKLYEVQKYVTLDGHVYTTQIVVVNDKFYQSLPAPIREVLKRTVQLSQNVARGTALLYNATKLDLLREKGMTITPLSDEAKQQFMMKGQPVVRNMLISTLGKPYMDDFEKARVKANEDAQKMAR